MATDDFFRARLDSMIDMRHPLAVLAKRWLRLSEHRTSFDKWSPAGLTSAKSCPRRRAGVAYDERTTAAVGKPCSRLQR